jgi:hypothetical protein
LIISAVGNSSFLDPRKASLVGSWIMSSPAGIDCGDTCRAQFAEGTAVTLISTGRIFQEWSGDCSGKGACVVTMDRDRTVTAVFVVDSGPSQTCHVPKLVGLPLPKAVARIARARCTLGKVVRRRSSKARKNRVLAQSPKPGTRRPPRARIRLTVGKGPTKR